MSGRGAARGRRQDRAWVAVVAAAAVLGALSFALPGEIPPRAALDAASALATAGAFAGAARRARPVRAAWYAFAAGLAAWLLGDVAWDWYTVTRGEPPTVSVADAFYLAGYPLMFAAVWRMARHRAPGGNREVALDAATMGIAAALATWQFLVVPNFSGGMSILERVTTASYPLVDVLLVAALGWLAWSPGRRTAAAWPLVGSLALTLALDLAYAVIPRFLPDVDLVLLDAVYPLSYALLAAAALHPDADRLTEPPDRPDRRLHPARLAFLGAALLAAPTITVLGEGGGLGDVHDLIRFAGTVALTAIVLVRFARAAREREVAHEAVAYQATHDALTGLVNRPLLLDRLEQALARATRTDATIAVLFLDLDRFKEVNDTYGHRAGDRLLVEVAARLRASVRPGDTVARVGGDEFVVLCEDVSDPNAPIEIAERIVSGLNRPVALDAIEVVTPASVGIALGVHAGETAEALLHHADAALYRAKELGRGRWELFDADMRAWVERRRSAEVALRAAVEQAELRLVYQPVVELATGAVVGFEALVRWHRDGHGPVPTEDLIELAQDSGLIAQIDEWALGEACRQVRLWNEEHPDRAPVYVSVNVSGRQLGRSNLAAAVERAVRRAGIDPAWLMLEIPEPVLVSETGPVLAQLEAIRRAGVGLAADDFGAGYSTLAHLRTLPISLVKVDRQFLRDWATPSGTSVVAAVVTLTHALGHAVVAEGTEHREQVEVLRGLGCDYAQGFYFSQPLTLAEASALLRSERRLPPRAWEHRAERLDVAE